jgi:hypothetical protein
MFSAENLSAFFSRGNHCEIPRKKVPAPCGAAELIYFSNLFFREKLLLRFFHREIIVKFRGNICFPRKISPRFFHGEIIVKFRGKRFRRLAVLRNLHIFRTSFSAKNRSRDFFTGKSLRHSAETSVFPRKKGTINCLIENKCANVC